MSTAEYKNSGIHVFVFCCADYKDIVNDCVDSIDQFVTDPILSRNIVSNTNINIKDYNLIRDEEFWQLLDPEFKYKNLYNHNWIKQQIFKLNLDRYADGNILVVDAEVRFHNPIQWIENEQQMVFYVDKWNNSDEFIKQTINIEADKQRTFVVEAIIFNSRVLQEIRKTIEKLHQSTQMSVYQQISLEDPESINSKVKSGIIFSEYDLYINYLLQHQSNKAYNLVKQDNNTPFYSSEHPMTSNSLDSQTRWLTFYHQIRGTNWPDCDREDKFENLPQHIKDECTNVYGYVPK